MPNLTTSKVLDVYLSGCYIGKLSTEQGMLSFAYDALYLQSKEAVKLSASLPLQHDSFNHQTTAAFFSGLLPDDGVRQRDDLAKTAREICDLWRGQFQDSSFFKEILSS